MKYVMDEGSLPKKTFTNTVNEKNASTTAPTQILLLI